MLLKNIKILLNCKYSFLPPKKSEIIIFDQHSLKIISTIFNLKNTQVLKTRKEEINLFILLKNFINFKFTFFEYLMSFIIYSQAKVVTTSIDNNKTFYKIASNCSATTIFFQNGVRMGHNDIFDLLRNAKELKNIRNSNFVNLMFTFNQMTSDLYKKIITGKTFISGSILSNNEKINKNKKSGLIYISLFRPESKRKTHPNEIRLVRLLEKYCIKKNLKFKILCKFLRGSKKSYEEINFYKKTLKKDFLVIPNSLERNSYKLLDQSKIVVSSGSTMGIESLGRKNRTVIINPFPNVHPIKRNFFGYFTKRKNTGFFWHNGVNEKKIFKILNNVKNCKNKNWHKIISKCEYETTKHDPKNMRLKKNLIKILAQKKINFKKYLRT